jgi:transcriptional regulator with XRE-family HTH domain
MISTLGSKKCYACGAKRMSKKPYAHMERFATVAVVDETESVYTCAQCGEIELTTAQLTEYERRAAREVLRDGRYVTGSVVRTARKAMGLKQRELALLLGCSPELISRWENNQGGADKEQFRRAERLALMSLLDLERIELRAQLDALTSGPRPLTEDDGGPQLKVAASGHARRRA